MEKTKKLFESVFRKSWKALIIIVLLLFLNVGNKSPLMSESKKLSYNTIELTTYPIVVRTRIEEKLVNEVKTYIERIAPTSEVDPKLLVNLAQQYELDITFVLAQAVIESHFGTKGKAVTTHSMFNVGAHDNGKVYNRYKHENESIEPYMQLLKNQYLFNKDLTHLLKDQGFKNTNGKRYATSPIYEQQLRSLIVVINMETSIKMYQDVMKLSDEEILAHFGPPVQEQPINDKQFLSIRTKNDNK